MAHPSLNSAATCKVLQRNHQSFFEGGHQLEKLEFALAVAITRGDANRSELLRGQIAELGGNIEEPGT
ncbi:hypothetical protein [Synechococcus sp. ROS8604]|uniref:hypothetical protein n=1 Tax=Synechococcus sp. ROS8604 TaxID=1442557 RepID=UPI001644293C|nr:hypothetical protein [Synechococcus sp. ROS8604]QNI86718.1 hypothetical protein SynROS8604_00045 [Synechococcus sp. ROS8604]